jgi:hypothetical protein
MFGYLLPNGEWNKMEWMKWNRVNLQKSFLFVDIFCYNENEK